MASDLAGVLKALAVCAKQMRAEVVAGVEVGELIDDLHTRGLAEFAAETAAAWGLHDVMRMFVLKQPASRRPIPRGCGRTLSSMPRRRPGRGFRRASTRPVGPSSDCFGWTSMRVDVMARRSRIAAVTVTSRR